MIELTTLVRAIDRILSPARFRDYCPNGLQVEGRAQVTRLATGVTACQAFLEAAAAWSADAVLIHHGYFWRGEDPCLVGMKRRRIAFLLDHDISLLAYHLPLDAHDTLGNNAQLALRLGLQVETRFGDPAIGMLGRLATPTSPGDFAAHIQTQLARRPLHIDGGKPRIERIAWSTGAAQASIEEVARLGVDAYVSGEVSEPTVHIAREYGIHYFAAGHHATERYGVMALGQHLAEHHGLEHRFLDIDNPV